MAVGQRLAENSQGHIKPLQKPCNDDGDLLTDTTTVLGIVRKLKEWSNGLHRVGRETPKHVANRLEVALRNLMDRATEQCGATTPALTAEAAIVVTDDVEGEVWAMREGAWRRRPEVTGIGGAAPVSRGNTPSKDCFRVLAHGQVGWKSAMVYSRFLDEGRVSRKAKVTVLLKEFKANAHFTTPRHPRSHGTIIKKAGMACSGEMNVSHLQMLRQIPVEQFCRHEGEGSVRPLSPKAGEAAVPRAAWRGATGRAAGGRGCRPPPPGSPTYGRPASPALCRVRRQLSLTRLLPVSLYDVRLKSCRCGAIFTACRVSSLVFVCAPRGVVG
ncbi:hypothetical protein AAG570_011603 [Ranatra chinensis]|uniref:Uncharacterized protein n=1 Tax=Ranatra chinensis TaxID=642074 RepID=A0ABD0Z7C4_9HEMI